MGPDADPSCPSWLVRFGGAQPGSTHNIATAKLGIATRLRKETTLSIKAIAARLYLGSFKSANIRLHADEASPSGAINPRPGSDDEATSQTMLWFDPEGDRLDPRCECYINEHRNRR